MKQKTNVDRNTIGTFIGSGIILDDANIKGTGTIRIDGDFRGTINLDGHVILGESGVISGDVFSTSALFAGKFDGNLDISDILHVTSTAKMTGCIETGKIIIDEGGIFNGTCNVAIEANKSNSFPEITVLEA